MIDDDQSSCLILTCFGHVQGVGMRPLMFRTALELDLKGQIYNHRQGVTAELEGSKQHLKMFHEYLIKKATLPIVISETQSKWGQPRGYTELKISTSLTDSSPAKHSIQSDASTCEECWADFLNPNSRFFNYPFVTCAQCGPRWSILQRFPFERFNTSYDSFKMCALCESDYNNPRNRRHHAQTMSCPSCGPSITLFTPSECLERVDLTKLPALLMNGSVGMIKGLGGFQLIGDAHHPKAIDRIRALKSRPSQSLAIMIRDEATFLKMGGISKDWKHLRSPVAPIVSLKNLDHPMSHKLAPDLTELGVMAPTTPLHFQLFQNGISSLMITSGNPKGRAMPISRQENAFALGTDIDFIIDHNRQILRGVDDSVLRGDLVLRKARGLTPCLHKFRSIQEHSPNALPIKSKSLALGAELKNALALKFNDEIIEFPYCGDLSHQALLEKQSQSLQDSLKLFDLNPEDCGLSAVDFLSESTAHNLSKGPHIQIPHHWAHAWSAYQECPSDLVLAFDGTGFDNPNEMGGGEGFVLSNNTWQPVLRLKAIKWVGGDSSVLEPWKSLALNFASAQVKPDTLHRCFPDLPTETLDVFYAYARSGEGLLCTSMGRWFDAASALIEFGSQKQTYEAQAPIRLEHRSRFYPHSCDITPFVTSLPTKDRPLVEINGAALLLELFKQKHTQKISIEHMAFIAHDLMAQSVARACHILKVQSVTGCGGVFQNEVFSSLLTTHLKSVQISFKRPKLLPVNDQAIAIGQLYYLEQLHA